jgi:hypothetical protein
VSRHGRWLAGAALVLAVTRAGASAAAEPPAPDLATLLDRLERSWEARDLDGYMALWAFASEQQREHEAAVAELLFSAEELHLLLERPAEPPHGPVRGVVPAQVFVASEPRARVHQWQLVLGPHAGGWAIAERHDLGSVDGLVHLSLEPRGFRADGLTLALEDFTLRMERGTLFTSPQELGPTVLVFAGEGEVRVTPRPDAERQQLRQLSGRTELVERVRTAFVRIHPADLHRFLTPPRLEPDPASGLRFAAAERFYHTQVERSFVLDSDLPRAPWWLLPGLGDALVSFPTRRHGTLTFTVSRAEPEDLSLFDRDRRRQILLYPSGGRSPHYNEDDGRTYDILDHDLHVRFEPRTLGVSGRSTLRLRLLAPVSTIRLRLHDDFAVHSVTSPEGGNHLFFRLRHQSSLVVALGAYAGTLRELPLTLRYSGRHDPAPIEGETLQIQAAPPDALEDAVPIERTLVYSNRSAWHPRAAHDDHATVQLRFDVPSGQLALAGGELLAAAAEADRRVVRLRQVEPGKYITAAVGRLSEVDARPHGRPFLRGFGQPRTRREVPATLDQAQSVLAFLADEFGPCPYAFLNLALIEGYTPGGHSPPGMIVVQQRPALLAGQRRLRDDPASFADVPGFVLAHELAHQWWGHGVAPQNYRERWLSEAWAQYAAALWVRQSRGEDAFRGVLARMGRWALRHSDQGPIHLGHRLGHLRDDPQIFRAVVYNKGAYVLHMLRGLMGDEAFRDGARRFQASHRFAKAGTEHLREAFERASGKDLRPYFEQWIYRTELPSLRYRWRAENAGAGWRTKLNIEAEHLPGPLPLLVELDTASGRLARALTLTPGATSFEIESETRPRRVELNGNRALLARIRRR